MNIIEDIRKLPKGRLLTFEHLPVPDDYRGRKTDDLIALAESHERLLAAVKQDCKITREAVGEDRADVAFCLSLEAVKEAEKL